MFNYIYFVVVGISIISVLALALTDTIQLDCEKMIYSYHWFILNIIDTILSVLILISERKIRKFVEEQIYISSKDPSSSFQIANANKKELL